MTRRACAGTGMLLLAFLAAAMSAGTGSARLQGPAGHAQQAQNVRWSGYVVTAKRVRFSGVAGTWTLPRVRCTPGSQASLSTVWVGIGGYSVDSTALDQVGTDANCDATGHATYFAWFELLPDIAHHVTHVVKPGDTMRGSVVIEGTNSTELELADLTRGWTFDTTIQVGTPDLTSAEWVVEAPYSCARFDCHQAPLANFGLVAMHDVSVIGNGRKGTLASGVWKPTALQALACPPSGTKTAPGAVAVPGRVSPDGTAFAVAWTHRLLQRSQCSGGSVGGLPDYTLG
jgi:Peptidase A4 family